MNNDGYKSFSDIIEEDLKQLSNLMEQQPFFAFVILSIIIEVFGRCINPASGIHVSGKSEEDFNYALEHLTSLRKYKDAPFNLYTSLRCNLAHALLAGSDIILTTEPSNLGKKKIGVRDFFNDINAAWEEVKKDEKAIERLRKKEIIISGPSSGGTHSSLTKIIR